MLAGAYNIYGENNPDCYLSNSVYNAIVKLRTKEVYNRAGIPKQTC